METRSRKKATVTFASDEHIKHIICGVNDKEKPRYQNDNSLRKKPCYKEDEFDEDSLSDFKDDYIEDKSTVLCNDSEVTGQEMFGFSQTDKRRLSIKVKESLELQDQTTPKSMSLALKRSNTPSVEETTPFVTPTRKSARKQTPRNTPKTPRNTPQNKTPSQKATVTPSKTPRSSQRKKEPFATPKSTQKPAEIEDLAKTPFNLRRRFQQKISKKMLTEELGLSSDSDYNVSDSDSESSDQEEQEDEKEEAVEDEEEEEGEEERRVETMKVRRQPLRRHAAGQMEELKFVIDSDEFFRMDKSKSHTSGHTLSRLRTACLPAAQLAHFIGPHGPHMARLLADQRARYFQRWLFALAEGFSVLVYGAGSKRQLLDEFRRQMLDDEPVVVCNGFFPSLTIKELCDSILEAAGGSTSDASSVELVEQALRGRMVTLIVHNLDGPCIRVRRFQELVARLVGTGNVQLVASVDHINAPLMWDQTMLSQYNFCYWDATSLHPYTEETSYEGSLLLHQSGALMLSSLNNVFRSLTTNAQGIYLIIVRYQLALSKAEKRAGMPFKDLYRRCREELLVSSDLILRTQLTEFLDHKLVTCKRGPGGEKLHIPLEDTLLQAFLQDRQGNEL